VGVEFGDKQNNGQSGLFDQAKTDKNELAKKEQMKKLEKQAFVDEFRKVYVEHEGQWWENFIENWQRDEDENIEWQKRHALLIKDAMDTAKDEDLEEMRRDRDDEKRTQVTLVMAENRLKAGGLWAASVAQKSAYAKKHGYNFHISATGKVVYDLDYRLPSAAAIKDAKGTENLCKFILSARTKFSNFTALADKLEFPSKSKELLKTCATIEETGDPERGIGAARAFAAQDHVPDYMKQAFYWKLDAINPGNGNYKQPFGVLEGTWSKIPAALEAMYTVPEGTWIWVLDTDITIMDDTQGLEWIVNEADKRGKEMIVCNWNCGDGVNMGSVMVKNTEWGRALYERIKDMRTVWHHYFYASSTGRTEQGAFWTIQANDAELGEKLFMAPPRSFNNRMHLAQCAGEPEQVARAYYHEGDFLIHYAALIRGDIGMAAYLKSLGKTGWWPCSEDKCTAESMHSTITPLKGQLGEPLIGASNISIVFIDNKTRSIDTKISEPAQNARAAWAAFASQKGLSSYGQYDADFYLPDGSFACPAKKQSSDQPREQFGECEAAESCTLECRLDYEGLQEMWIPQERNADQPLHKLPGTLGAYKLHAEGKKRNSLERKRGYIFLNGNGWAKIAVLDAILDSLKEETTNRWLLVADGTSTPKQEALGTTVDDILSATGGEQALMKYHLAVPGDCKGAWLIRSSATSRILMKRLQYGLMLQDGRIVSESTEHVGERLDPERGYAHPERALAERAVRAGAAETLCLLLRRDRFTAEAVYWLTPVSEKQLIEGHFDTDHEENKRLHYEQFNIDLDKNYEENR
jgi:hypothetical protein